MHHIINLHILLYIDFSLPSSAKFPDLYLEWASSLWDAWLKIATTFIGDIKAEENEIWWKLLWREKKIGTAWFLYFLFGRWQTLFLIKMYYKHQKNYYYKKWKSLRKHDGVCKTICLKFIYQNLCLDKVRDYYFYYYYASLNSYLAQIRHHSHFFSNCKVQT